MILPHPLRVMLTGVILLQAAVCSAEATVPMSKIEASFELPQVQGNPFDFTQNDVEVTLLQPKGTSIVLPAFYDGGTTWRVRHTPDVPGKYSIKSVTLNGKDAHPQQLGDREFNMTAAPWRGFIRIDPHDPMRFAFDDGTSYYPVGYDLAWHQNGSSPLPPLPESLRLMGKAKLNWTRIWMDYWDGKNLDWAQKGDVQPPLGKLSLKVAKRWDAIVDAAQANGMYLQMVLQHHGQYSTHSDANWAINPWNKANGGWLNSPVDFFSDPKAKSLTKSKYRYIIARWGYSPAIMAWELFNEVESTDAFSQDVNLVASWHEEMAKFVRQYDVYKHLVTTSARTTEPRLWKVMDYYQKHTYPSDMLSAIAVLEAEQLKRPYFYGEFGGPFNQASVNPAGVIHRGLWGSLMSQSSGASQYWFWYLVEPDDLVEFTSLQDFIALSGVPTRQSLADFKATLKTSELGALKLSLGNNRGVARQTRFTISRDAKSADLNGMSGFLQGRNEKTSSSATFDVDYPSPGTFALHVDQVGGSSGPKLELEIDEKPVSSLNLEANSAAPASPRGGGGSANGRIDATLTATVPAGKHSIRVENIGEDRVRIHELTLNPYASALCVLGKGNNNACTLWIYRRDMTSTTLLQGTLLLPNIIDGSYQVFWWDTGKGAVIKAETINAIDRKGLLLTTPKITSDLAVFVKQDKPG